MAYPPSDDITWEFGVYDRVIKAWEQFAMHLPVAKVDIL